MHAEKGGDELLGKAEFDIAMLPMREKAPAGRAD